MPIFRRSALTNTPPSSVADFDEVTINLKPDVTVALENQSSVIVDDSNSDFDGAFSFDAVITNIGLADANNVSLDLQELNLVGTELTAVDEQGAPIGTLTVSSNGETATLTGLGTLASDESIRVTFTGQTDAIGPKTPSTLPTSKRWLTAM